MADKTLKQRIQDGEIVRSIGVPMDIEGGYGRWCRDARGTRNV